MKMFLGTKFDHPIFSTTALKGSIAAFAADAIASAYAEMLFVSQEAN